MTLVDIGKIYQQIQKSVLDMISSDVITNICFVDHFRSEDVEY